MENLKTHPRKLGMRGVPPEPTREWGVLPDPTPDPTRAHIAGARVSGLTFYLTRWTESLTSVVIQSDTETVMEIYFVMGCVFIVLICIICISESGS